MKISDFDTEMGMPFVYVVVVEAHEAYYTSGEMTTRVFVNERDAEEFLNTERCAVVMYKTRLIMQV